MDNDFFGVDMSEVFESIDRAEVLTVFFPVLRRTLLVDARSNESDGPWVGVVPMVATPEDRLRELERMRPRFPRPDSITFIPWSKYIDSLERLGVIERLCRRFAASGQDDVVERCRDAFGELQKLERVEIRNAIAGEGYQTLWSADESGALDDEEDEDDDEF
ncbi:MAG: hypothetical protein GEU28_14050 [Dehalococcoidia bacterium]|nr:hypothetical protein [Dehalococcoidia bacterium]